MSVIYHSVFVLLVNVCYFLLFFFCTNPRDWLRRTSPQWPILRRVGRKIGLEWPTAAPRSLAAVYSERPARRYTVIRSNDRSTCDDYGIYTARSSRRKVRPALERRPNCRRGFGGAFIAEDCRDHATRICGVHMRPRPPSCGFPQ